MWDLFSHAPTLFLWIQREMGICGALSWVNEIVGLFFSFFFTAKAALFHLGTFIGVYSFSLFFFETLSFVVLLGIASFFCESRNLCVNIFPSSLIFLIAYNVKCNYLEYNNYMCIKNCKILQFIKLL